VDERLVRGGGERARCHLDDDAQRVAVGEVAAPERAAVAPPAWVARLIVAVGPTELRCLRTMAYCLGALREGRWPK
jgi:hypothetical protein